MPCYDVESDEDGPGPDRLSVGRVITHAARVLRIVEVVEGGDGRVVVTLRDAAEPAGRPGEHGPGVPPDRLRGP